MAKKKKKPSLNPDPFITVGPHTTPSHPPLYCPSSPPIAAAIGNAPAGKNGPIFATFPTYGTFVDNTGYGYAFAGSLPVSASLLQSLSQNTKSELIPNLLYQNLLMTNLHNQCSHPFNPLTKLAEVDTIHTLDTIQ